MSLCVRSDSIWERQSLLIERAGRQTRAYVRRVQRRLLSARLPGLVATVESVRIGGLLTRARPFLVVCSGRMPDVRLYVGARSVGRHLEVLSITAVEPIWPKRVMAGALHRGAWWTWSLPGGVAGQEDLRSLLTLVESTVQSVARQLAARARGNLLLTEPGNPLDVWH